MRKGRIAGAALCMLLLFGGSALADGGYKSITAYMDRIAFEINGNKLGEANDSLIYNGTVYVPVEELARLMGAETSWDSGSSTLNLDFLADGGRSELADVTRSGIYQYAALENNAILKALVDSFKADDMAAAKTAIARYEKLRGNMLGLPDKEAAGYIAKMKAAAELMRSGWSAKKFENYYIAWTIYNDNAAKLNTLLRSRLQNTASAGGG